MGTTLQEIENYEKRITASGTMTELLVIMSSWQSFAEAKGLSKEERAGVEAAYIRAERRLIAGVKSTPW
ncbi:MAG: hypothetical protein Q4D60_07755 [Eubacteriales bacterium]|nr:hypothetical protein [Eubacteriales bacterium]